MTDLLLWGLPYSISLGIIYLTSGITITMGIDGRMCNHIRSFPLSNSITSSIAYELCCIMSRTKLWREELS